MEDYDIKSEILQLISDRLERDLGIELDYFTIEEVPDHNEPVLIYKINGNENLQARVDVTVSNFDIFPWNLQNGDDVFWKDPDDGLCSRTYTVSTIEYHGIRGDDGCIIRITDVDGNELECFAHELK